MINKEKYLINTTDKNENINLIILTEEEYKLIDKDMTSIRSQTDVNRFLDTYGIKASTILLYGDTNISKLNKEDKEYILDEFTKILPKAKTINNPITRKVENTYKCFCCDNLNVGDLTDHKTAYSSFSCLMAKLRKPNYILIYKSKDN